MFSRVKGRPTERTLVGRRETKVVITYSMVTHPVIGGYQLSVQSETIRISYMQFTLIMSFQM